MFCDNGKVGDSVKTLFLRGLELVIIGKHTQIRTN